MNSRRLMQFASKAAEFCNTASLHAFVEFEVARDQPDLITFTFSEEPPENVANKLGETAQNYGLHLAVEEYEDSGQVLLACYSPATLQAAIEQREQAHVPAAALPKGPRSAATAEAAPE